jgi:hypothetical protein
MLLTNGSCNSRVTIAAWEFALRYPYRLHPDANVFQRSEQCLHETGNVALTAHENAVRPRTVHECAMTVAVEGDL